MSKYLLSISWLGQLISPNLHLSSLKIPDPHPASNLFSFLNQQNFLSSIDILWQGKLFFWFQHNWLQFTIIYLQNDHSLQGTFFFLVLTLFSGYTYKVCQKKIFYTLDTEPDYFPLLHFIFPLFSLSFEEIPLLDSHSWVGAQVDEDQFRTLINLIFCVLIFLEAHNNSNQKQNCVSKPTQIHSKLSAAGQMNNNSIVCN